MIRPRLMDRVRQGLLKAGGHISARNIERLRSISSYLEIGQWLKEMDTSELRRVASKEEVFAIALKRARAASHPLYLEFGVWQGLSHALVGL